jgi:peptidylprolyl isomerase
MRKLFTLLTLLIMGATTAMAQQTDAPIFVMELEDGVVEIQTRPDLAPKHVERLSQLVSEGFYDGLVFHRVIDGFMVQTGDPNGNGTGGSGVKLPAEFNNTVKHTKGIVSMARTNDPNSGDSQFFIMLGNASHLDGRYSIWGEVIDGMEHVDAIKKGDSYSNGAVEDPDKIVRMYIKGE